MIILVSNPKSHFTILYLQNVEWYVYIVVLNLSIVKIFSENS